MFSTRQQLSFHYPLSNDVRYRNSPMEQRNITVLELRDLIKNPLTVEEFTRRPYIRRSRWLIRAWDHDRNQERFFYPGSSAEFAAPCTIRVGAFCEATGELLRMIDREYRPTAPEKELLLQRLPVWECEQLLEGERLGIFSADMRLVK